MGGTGQATIDGASSIAHNPANLDSVDSFEATLSITPFILRPAGPFASPPPDMTTPPVVTNREADLSVVPLFFGGFGVRVHDRLVVGLGAQVRTGFGATFRDVPELMGNDLDLTIAVVELQIPFAIRIMDGLSLAIALRFEHMKVENTIFDFMATPTGGLPVVIEQDMTGFGLIPGASVGVAYRPVPELRLGLTYRSKIEVELDGSTEVAVSSLPTMDFSTEIEFATPHVLQLGAAYSGLEERLTVAVDFVARFYDEANNQILTMDRATGAQLMGSQAVALNWENVYEGHFGVEYRVVPALTLRLGYAISNSATPGDSAQVLIPPPGLFHLIGGGLGLHLGDFDVDVAAGSMLNGATASPNPPGAPGRYDTATALVGLSVSYRRGAGQQLQN